MNQVYWAKPVPTLGDPKAKLLVIGLAPAAHGGAARLRSEIENPNPKSIIL